MLCVNKTETTHNNNEGILYQLNGLTIANINKKKLLIEVKVIKLFLKKLSKKMQLDYWIKE